MRKRIWKLGPIFFVVIVMVVFNATPYFAEDKMHENDSKVSVNDDGMSGGYIYLQVDNIETMRVVDGKVGIRTPEPTEMLDVNGTARVRDLPEDNTLNDIVVANLDGILHTRDLNSLVFAFNIITISDDYTPKSSDYTILVDASSNDITVKLPSASDAYTQVLVLKRIDNNKKTKVTIDADGSEKIDGDLSVTLKTKFMSYTIQSDGSNWYILASYGFMGNSHIGNKNR